MITLKKMRWSNLFSYGENNEIDFSAAPLTQIVGYNGHGKSSIALILEEVLYNKNSKGIKKADILNRNVTAKSYSIELEFNKDGDEYVIKTTRSSTQTVKLLKNGEDISAHTATATYKMIEDIIGYDHKTFGQIVYQSNSSSLEFLTATDTNRKKFLIDLLNLNRYVEAGDTFKGLVKDLSNDITVVTTKIQTTENLVAKHSKVSLEEMELQDVPENPRHLVEEVSGIKEQINNIDTTNKKIIQNNKYKELRDGIKLEPLGPKPDTDVTEYKTEKIECNKASKDAEAFILKMRKLGTVCPTCTQDIDSHRVQTIIDEQLSIKEKSDARAKELTNIISELTALGDEWDRKSNNNKLYEEYHALYDPNMQADILDKADLQKLIKQNEDTISKIDAEIKRINDHNAKATAHNAKIEVIKSQLEEAREALVPLREELAELTDRHATLSLLVKTFSPTGLVAYKIECLIKDLEEVSNKYLSDLSGGRFQLAFKIAASDKLNVVVTDNGKDIEIIALSGGERARVNVAALLGIRKLMQSLSNTRINLLILDETLENLDLEGKEKLVEVLLQEEHLNTFVVSHGFSHPLLEKLTVTKKKNISRVE